jgi:excisionase family DNA binding protein
VTPVSQEEHTVKLLSVKDVAQMLGVSTPTVLRLADAGTLPAVVVTQRQRKRLIRFRLESVEKFITSCEQRSGR